MKPKPTKIHKRQVEVMQWTQPDNLDVTLLDEIDAAHKNQPHPVTYTVISTSKDAGTPEGKRRLFANLHRQLGMEVEKALECGSWTTIEAEVKEARGHVAKPVEHWEDMDVTLFEPRVRELVRLLIKRRREVAIG